MKIFWIILLILFFTSEAVGEEEFGIIINPDGTEVEPVEQSKSEKKSRKLKGAKHYQMGIGIIFGEPSGLSGRYGITKNTMIDAALSYSLQSGKKVNIHADYLFKLYNKIEIPAGNTSLYFGLGARMIGKSDDKMHFGGRVPGGILYRHSELPFEIFAETAFIMDIFPATRVDLNMGIGARYCF